jgi:hypothetical protein
MKIIAACVAGLIASCAPPLIGAASAAAIEIGDSVAGRPDLTYLDLMKLIVTDLAPDEQGGAVGHHVVAFDHIDGKEAKGDPPAEIALTSLETMSIPGDPSRVLVLADLGPSEGFVADAVLLALFAVAPKPRLLDVVEIGTDRSTGFSDAKVGLLAPRTPLILVYSTHNNSNQTYLSTKMMFVRGDRFRLIDSLFTFGDRNCADESAQDPTFAVFAGRTPYSVVHVSVVERVTQTGQDCGDQKPRRAHVKTYQANYRWDARRQIFTTQSKQLERLAAEDQKRF